MNNDNEGSSVITQPLFWEDGKENRKYGLHRATIDVVPTHSYPTDSYMSRFTKSLLGGRGAQFYVLMLRWRFWQN